MKANKPWQLSASKFNSILFFILLRTISVCAQMDTEVPQRIYMDRLNIYQGQSDDYAATLSLHSALEINSTAITNSFVKSLLFQGHLSERAKDDVSSKLKNSNRAGYDFTTGITGTLHRDEYTIIGSVNYRENFNAKFPRDLFEIVFRGNKNYAGQLAVLSPAQVNYFSYQSVFLGVSKQLNSSDFIIGGGLSFLNGLQYQQVNIARANLYTSDDGEYIDVDAKFNVQYSKNKLPLFAAGNGAGAALNLNIARWTEKSRFNFELKDFGFINWKKIDKSYADSSFRYEGIEVQHILNYQNYSFHGFDADSIKKEYHLGDKISNTSKWVPFTLNANYTYMHNDKIHFMLGAKYMAFSNYFPKIYFKTLYYVRPRFMLAPALLFGGYGNLNLELAAVKSFNNDFVISGSVVCLGYLLAPSGTRGLSAQLAISKIF